MKNYSRRAKSLAILEGTAIRRSNYEPPYLRILWRLGFDVRPPHFVPFFQMAAIATAWFSIAFGTMMWAFAWSKQGWTVASAAEAACGAGTFWGFWMAAYYAHGRRKYRLPRWASL
jgi:hypothetical protein